MRVLHSPFAPQSADPKLLERLSVARRDLVAQLAADVGAAVAARSGRFELLAGEWGSGKSHLLALLEARLRSDPALRASSVVVSLGEHEHVSGLLDLLSRLLARMPEESGLPSPADLIESLRETPRDAAEDRAANLLAGRLDGRALVILIEDVDLVFEALRTSGQKRLRGILQTRRNWSIVATVRAVTSAFTGQSSPFFGTFSVRQIPRLDAEECTALLLRLARASGRADSASWFETAGARAQVSALRDLVDGNPRAVAMALPYLESARDDFPGAVRALAAELAPRFRAATANLPPAKRAVLDCVATHGRPLSVGEIAERTFNTHQTTSGLLRYLSQDCLVRAMSLGRERLYELSDPLGRLSRLVAAPHGRSVIELLLLWHGGRELLSALAAGLGRPAPHATLKKAAPVLDRAAAELRAGQLGSALSILETGIGRATDASIGEALLGLRLLRGEAKHSEPLGKDVLVAGVLSSLEKPVRLGKLAGADKHVFLLTCWCSMLADRLHTDAGIVSRLASAFGASPAPGWPSAVALALALLSASAVARGSPVAPLQALLATFDRALELGERAALARAILESPSSLQPFARLCSLERSLARELLTAAGAEALLARLPGESTFSSLAHGGTR